MTAPETTCARLRRVRLIGQPLGLGFLLAMVLFSGLRSRIDETNIPRPFKGLAVTLIAASFISLAFMGFAGIVDALFA